jgi:hypothetical protein
MLELDKRASSPLLYYLGFIVGRAEEGLPIWYQSHEISYLSPGHVYFTAHNYFHIQKSI